MKNSEVKGVINSFFFTIFENMKLSEEKKIGLFTFLQKYRFPLSVSVIGLVLANSYQDWYEAKKGMIALLGIGFLYNRMYNKMFSENLFSEKEKDTMAIVGVIPFTIVIFYKYF